MNFKKMTLSLVLSMAFGTAIAGIPYQNLSTVVTQPGGERLQLTVEGNLYYAEQRTKDGALVVYDAAKKGFCYAEVNAAGDHLISSGILASSNTPRLAAGKVGSTQAGLSAAARAKLAEANHARLNPQAHAADNAKLAASQSLAPLTGPVKGLTVMVQFPDQAGTITQTQVTNFLNGVPYTEFGNAQSVRGYYQSASGNKLDYTNVVPRYYTAKNKKSYYTDPNQPFGNRAQELIGEALAWLNNTEGFDFSTLTTDGSKRIRGLNFFYAGETDGGWSQGLWPHQGYMNTPFCADGVCTNGYQISNMSTALSIGTFVHESGHLLFSWPDLYDYDGSSLGSAGNFCIMGYGSVGAQSKLRPVLPNAFFRLNAGWDTATELNPALNAQAPKGVQSIAANVHTLYRWTNQANTNEAFYLEAIQKTGQNTNQPDDGLAVWHIDPAGNNSNEWHPYVQLEPADGKRDIENKVNYGDATDLYDGASYKAFNDTTPNNLTSKGTNAKWWNGSNSGFALSNIGVPGASVSVTIGAATPPTTDTYKGTLAASGQAIHPASGFVYAGGTLTIKLAGPTTAGVDFDVRLEKANGSTWASVASGTGPNAQESFSYVAASGTYRVVVYSYAGAGAYTLTVAR
jgi:M6 family metalloprotease-like protein